MPDSSTTQVNGAGYSTLQIALHWLIALLVLFQLVLGESMTEIIEATEEGRPAAAFEQQFSGYHYWVGLGILVLVALRFLLRLAQGVPPTDQGMPQWMRIASSATHWAFYALLVAVPATGLMGYYVGDPFGEIHAWAKPVFIALIVLHAAAALYHQFVRQDGLLMRMLVPK